jgi:hypothetical protein
LTWSTNTGDLDLHLTASGFDTCSEESCYFGNCVEIAEVRTDWDGIAGVTAGDPFLDDDSFGSGPELLTVESLVPDSYFLAVYMQPPSSDPPAQATVEVARNGVLVHRATRTLSPDQMWDVARIDSDTNDVVVLDDLCAIGDWICGEPAPACP